MADKARHAYGSSSGLEAALQNNLIDAYDILLLDGETEPKIGWVDKNNVVRIVEDKVQVVRVEELPTSDGDENVIYVYNNEGYIWDAVNSQCIPMSKSADLTTLENQVSTLETQIGNKVDADSVQSLIDTAVEEAVKNAASEEIVEF